ncbi:MAG: LPS-assembly protein LptD [Alphaproteobacteria bacterium]|nr:LPS-assembly protein LptD [Alphaproteobacteria bacterium]
MKRIVFSLTLLLACPTAAWAQDREVTEAPVLLMADEVSHDRELDIVTARGHVEIAQQGRVLLANAVTYNLKRDLITATGDISLLEPSGEVMFADYVELTGDLKTGVAEQIRLRLADNSRMAAVRGTRSGGVTSTMERAVYSACQDCPTDPSRPLVWQIKADRVVHDQTTKDIQYYDARIEMFGVPVAYTPYLSHPDPTVKRRSGFLPPSMGRGEDMGATIQIPYLYVLSPSQDFTFAPIFSSDEGAVLYGDHRVRFQNGEARTRASVTEDSNGEVRGHIDAQARFDLNETWRAGYEIARSTDDTYMRRYGFQRGQPWLVSRPYVEAFGSRTHLLAEAFSFQGLRETDDPGQSPFVLPSIQYSSAGEPGRFGGYWTMDASLLSLTRDEGTDSHRISMEAGYTLPYTAPAGDIYTFRASLRGDGYRVADLPGDEDGFAGRVVPEASLEWRYPFTRDRGTVQEVLEPIVLGAISPIGQNPDTIPNEDSRFIRFDPNNLFDPNHFTGLDLVEGGPRLTYGMRYGVYGEQGGYSSILVGQSWRLNEMALFQPEHGLDENFSDLVGKIVVSPGPWLDVAYSFRIDESDFQRHYDELSLSVGAKAARLWADYLFVDSPPGTGEFADREEVSLGLYVALTDRWSTNVFTRWALGDDPEPLTTGLHLVYDDECFTLAGSIIDNNTTDRDIGSGISVLLRVVFKTLGEVPLTFM